MSDMEFDFEYWRKLAQEKPDEYEEIAQKYVHDYIDKHYAGDEDKIRRLKGLYWKITNDPEIRNIKNPTVRADRANTKMWLSLRKLNALLIAHGFGDNSNA